MPIFDLDTILSFVFYPDSNKKRHRNSQEYRLNVDQYSKNGSDETDNATLKQNLKNLKVLCLGIATKSEKLPNKLASVKLRIEEKKQYKLKKEFQSPNENNPLPLLLFYKKKKAKTNIKLTNILNLFFLQIISLFEQRNLKIKKFGSNKEAFINIENKYRNQIKQIAEDIFNEIGNVCKEINIIGIFIDPYFVRKEHNNFVLVDTRPADTLPRKKNDIQQEPNFFKGTSNLDLMDSGTVRDSNLSDESFSLDRLFDESIGNEVENLYVLSEVIAKNVSDDAQLNLQAELKDTNIDFVENRSIEIVNAVSTNTNPVALLKYNTFDWDAEVKSKINCLLLGYKKWLKKYDFFYDTNITNRKQFIINDLLNKLNNSSCQDFFCQLQKNSTEGTLNEHRSFLSVPILSYLFNHNKKTKGQLLLDNLLSNLSENTSTINSQSV